MLEIAHQRTLRSRHALEYRFMGTKRVKPRKGATHEPLQQSGRAVVPRRLDFGAAQQHSPT